MHRPILITVLVLGALGGLVMAAHSHRYHQDHREAFKQKVADVCTESALRVYEKRTPNPIDPQAP